MTMNDPLRTSTHAAGAALAGSDEAPYGEWGARQFLEAVPAAMYATDAQGRLTMFNDAAVALWGRRPEPGEQWCGSLRIYKLDGSPLPLDECPMALAIRDGREQFGHEVIVERPDGSRRHVLPHPRPLHDASGNVIGAVNMLVDITDRIRAESALRVSDERYRAVVECQSEMICRFRPEGTILFVNPAYARTLARDADALVGQSFWQFIDEEDKESIRAQLDRITPDNPIVRIENRFETADGPRWTLWTNRGLAFDRDNRATEVQSTGIDITDRKQVELALRESEERFRTLADNMHQFAWMADPAGWIFWYNRRWYDFTGTTLEQMEGWGWKKVHHPEHVDRVESSLRRSLETGEPWEDIFPLRAKDGEYRWFLSRALPIRDADGQITRWFGTNTDITERREMEQQLAQHKSHLETRVEERTRELRETHERLRMSERMAMMGSLSAGLGHDMGNLLLPVRVRLESLAQQPLSEQAREDVEAIRISAEYLRRLANGLRLLALDPERAPPGEATDLDAWWADARGVLKSALARGMTLEADFDAPDAHVAISRAALTQIVFNLVQNASDAMSERGHGLVTISARRSGSSLLLSVTDNGPGMTPEVRERCMEPYFSTKTRGISTGLGLVLVYGLMREARGEVDIKSAAGHGTTITLRLQLTTPLDKPADANAPRRRAVVDVKDARIRSFISGELRTLRFDTADFNARNGADDLYVIDDPGMLQDVPQGSHVMYLGTTPRADVRALGDRPSISTIRETLREMARPAVTIPRRDGVALARTAPTN